MACGEESVNLDARFTTPAHIREVFSHYNKEVNIVEGVMGLYDGYDRWKGSSAEMASILDLPVLLIVNARSMAYSAAAVIHGFTSLSCENLPSLRFAGVIFNQVGSERHASFLKQACEDAGTVCLGCIPRLPDMEIPSRHLGLSLENRDFIEQIICRAADAVEQHVDLKAMGL
jgi:cobyrinic acid a,c-diamide synthase